MAKTTPAKDSADDFDDLLSDETVTGATSAAESDADDVESFDELLSGVETLSELTPEQIRIQELEAQLAALASPEEAKEIELTPEQLRIRELEALLAERNSPAETVAKETATTGTGEKILFHFVRDGMLVLGNVWLRGQEVEIEVGSKAYQTTLDDDGVSWLGLLGDVNGQYSRWGEQFIAPGPFVPRPDEKFEDEVAVADQKRRRRPVIL